jgi:hypothetical protein
MLKDKIEMNKLKKTKKKNKIQTTLSFETSDPVHKLETNS